ncbi:MAG: HD domain-containing protein [Pseudomonadota bacterium]
MWSNRFINALDFALKLHAGQKRKGSNISYAAHLFAVASIVLEHGAGEDETIAALLHDAVEDQGGIATLKEIRDWFGNIVADMVYACSDTTENPKPPWKIRKKAYLEHLADAPPSILLISAADKLHNARSMLADYRLHKEKLWKKFAGKKQGTLWYYHELIKTFRKASPPSPIDQIVDELERVVLELNALVIKD